MHLQPDRQPKVFESALFCECMNGILIYADDCFFLDMSHVVSTINAYKSCATKVRASPSRLFLYPKSMFCGDLIQLGDTPLAPVNEGSDFSIRR